MALHVHTGIRRGSSSRRELGLRLTGTASTAAQAWRLRHASRSHKAKWTKWPGGGKSILPHSRNWRRLKAIPATENAGNCRCPPTLLLRSSNLSPLSSSALITPLQAGFSPIDALCNLFEQFWLSNPLSLRQSTCCLASSTIAQATSPRL